LLLEEARQHRCLKNDVLLLNTIIGIKYRKIKWFCQGFVLDFEKNIIFSIFPLMQEERTLVSFDWAIKYLLRNKADYVILEGFLTTLLGRGIKIQSLAESESNKASEEDKYNRTDVLAEEEDGTLIIIELQFTPEIDYFHRMLFGSSKAYVDIRRSNKSSLYTAKLEGKAEGKIEGEAIGEVRGIEKGKTEGIAEVAKNMKSEDISLGIISKVTGLSVEEIEKL
jgi:hypothetical protein